MPETLLEDSSKKPKKEKKEKKDKKEKKEKKKHKKEKKDRRGSDDRDIDAGTSDEEQTGRSAEGRKRIEEDLRQKALQSARRPDSSDD